MKRFISPEQAQRFLEVVSWPITSLPSGAIVTVNRADDLSPTMLVAQCRDKEFIIFERDLWDAIPVAEAQDDVFVMLKRAAG